MPLYTPVKRRLSNSANVCIKFTEEEQEEFQQMYDDVSDDDDYDGGDNPRCRSWLQMYHPEMLSDSPLPTSYLPAVKQSSLGQFLSIPDSLVRHPLPSTARSLRVLTSKENLERIEEKEKEKQKKVKEKAERAKTREAKKMLKEKAIVLVKSQHVDETIPLPKKHSQTLNCPSSIERMKKVMI